MSALKESEIYRESIIGEIGKMNLKPLTIELHGFVSKMSSYLRKIKTPTENDLGFVRQMTSSPH